MKNKIRSKISPHYVSGVDRYGYDIFLRMSHIVSFRRFLDPITAKWVLEFILKDKSVVVFFATDEDESKDIAIFVYERGLSNV